VMRTILISGFGVVVVVGGEVVVAEIAVE